MLHLTQQVLVWADQRAAEVAVSLAVLAAAAWAYMARVLTAQQALLRWQVHRVQ
jgi:hypothetical protein